jgi:hypothetical protein
MATDTGNQRTHILAVEQPHVGKPQSMLRLDEGDQMLRFGVILRQQQVAALAVMQVGAQLLLQGRPACDRLDGQRSLGRLAPLAADAACAGPGGHRCLGNRATLDEQHALAIQRQVVGDRTTDNARADYEDINVLHRLLPPVHHIRQLYHEPIGLNILCGMHITRSRTRPPPYAGCRAGKLLRMLQLADVVCRRTEQRC